MGSTGDQFVRFTTDSYGLERMLRLLQALVQIIFAVPYLSLVLTGWINRLPGALGSDGTTFSTRAAEKLLPRVAVADTVLLLADLRGRLALSRRVLRLFRFAEAFHGAGKLAAASSGNIGLEGWLDCSSKAFNGMYLLIESVTIPDALGVPHLAVFEPKLAARLALEAQRFWFLALACSVAAGGVRIAASYALAAVPESGAGFSTTTATSTGPAKDGKKGEKGKEKEVEREVEERHREEKAMLAARAAQRRALVRKLVADTLDLALPGSVIGWISVDATTVSSAMLVTTILTGYDFWKKCA